MLTSSTRVRHIGALAIFTGLIALTGVVFPAAGKAADLSLPITGNLMGSVVDGQGIPQMGATIQLLNKYHQTIAKATSDVQGRFVFASLPADLYSLRASLASFLPVSRDKVGVKAGLDSVLQIHLATLVSSVEVSYILPSAAMSDDWKWVLRSSSATRPITRFLPADVPADGSMTRTPVFSGTHASLSLTGGDGGPLDSDSSFSDFGTAFEVSTEVFGRNHVQVSGSFGPENLASSPTISLGATYSRNGGQNGSNENGSLPEISFSATQVAGLGSQASLVASGTGAMLASTIPLRTMSLSIYEVTDPVSGVHLEYGVAGESVDYLQHTSRISPFARITGDLGPFGEGIVSYSDGGRPDELLRHSVVADSDETDLAGEDLAAPGLLQRLPQVSSREGKLVLQRTRSVELAYVKTAGSRTYAVSGFSENVDNGRLSVAGDFAPDLTPDILTDTVSRTAVYNMGRYRRTGYMASVNQRFGHRLEGALTTGRMGGFQAQLPDLVVSGSQMLREHNANFASASLRAVVPHLGTHIQTDYGWNDSSTVVPRHIFTTQTASAAPGFNVYVRQPMPSLFGLPGRLELTADLRNLLAQGYLPVATAGGRQMLIVQAPQSVRGGLSFIF